MKLNALFYIYAVHTVCKLISMHTKDGIYNIVHQPKPLEAYYFAVFIHS